MPSASATLRSGLSVVQITVAGLMKNRSDQVCVYQTDAESVQSACLNQVPNFTYLRHSDLG